MVKIILNLVMVPLLAVPSKSINHPDEYIRWVPSPEVFLYKTESRLYNENQCDILEYSYDDKGRIHIKDRYEKIENKKLLRCKSIFEYNERNQIIHEEETYFDEDEKEKI